MVLKEYSKTSRNSLRKALYLYGHHILSTCQKMLANIYGALRSVIELLAVSIEQSTY